LPAAKGKEAGAFKAGMFASGRFDLGASEALTLPQQAVVVRDGFNYVFRVNPDRKVSRVKVTAGRRIGDQVEITSGIDAASQVVVSGAGFLNDGDLVNVAAALAPAPAGSAAKAAKPR
jgi:multidrug efflux pump subunit AcrA (membrane-fusion protein)